MTEPIIYDSFSDFVKKNKETIFRYWVYKRLFTPYEQDNKFEDESIFEDALCEIAYIKECISLPNGDFLLGFIPVEYIEDPDIHYQLIDYYKLSEIRLMYCQLDEKNKENENE